MVEGSDRGSRRTRGRVAHRVSCAAAARRPHRADRRSVTGVARRGFTPVHDRGRVLGDLAVCIADGGRVLSDLATLRDQPELYGPVASDPTAVAHSGGDRCRTSVSGSPPRGLGPPPGVGADRARHGRIPPSRVADVDLGKTVVIRMDATIQIAHCDKEQARGHVQRHLRASLADRVVRQHRASPWRCGCGPGTPARTPPPITSRCSTRRSRRSPPGPAQPADHLRWRRRHPRPGRPHHTLNAVHGRRVHYSVGFDLDHRARTAIGQLPSRDWDHVLDHRGRPRGPDGAGVVELTGLLRTSVGGDQLANWPTDMRILCRRERPSAGAQLSPWKKPTAGATSCWPPTPRAGTRLPRSPPPTARPRRGPHPSPGVPDPVA